MKNNCWYKLGLRAESLKTNPICKIRFCRVMARLSGIWFLLLCKKKKNNETSSGNLISWMKMVFLPLSVPGLNKKIKENNCSAIGDEVTIKGNYIASWQTSLDIFCVCWWSLPCAGDEDPCVFNSNNSGGLRNLPLWLGETSRACYGDTNQLQPWRPTHYL